MDMGIIVLKLKEYYTISVVTIMELNHYKNIYYKITWEISGKNVDS